ARVESGEGMQGEGHRTLLKADPVAPHAQRPLPRTRRAPGGHRSGAVRRSGGERPQAVDAQGDVIRSEVVVWGCCARPQRRARRPALHAPGAELEARSVSTREAPFAELQDSW